MMSKTIADPSSASCFPLFSQPQTEEPQSLSPDPSPTSRARRARAFSPPEGPATRAAGHAASPIPGGACPILPPGQWHLRLLHPKTRRQAAHVRRLRRPIAGRNRTRASTRKGVAITRLDILTLY